MPCHLGYEFGRTTIKLLRNVSNFLSRSHMVQLQYELWSVARVVSLDEDTAESFKPVRYVVELVGDLRQS